MGAASPRGPFSGNRPRALRCKGTTISSCSCKWEPSPNWVPPSTLNWAARRTPSPSWPPRTVSSSPSSARRGAASTWPGANISTRPRGLTAPASCNPGCASTPSAALFGRIGGWASSSSKKWAQRPGSAPLPGNSRPTGTRSRRCSTLWANGTRTSSSGSVRATWC